MTYAVVDLCRNNAGVPFIGINEIGDDDMCYRSSVLASGYEFRLNYPPSDADKEVGEKIMRKRFEQLKRFMHPDTIFVNTLDGETYE